MVIAIMAIMMAAAVEIVSFQAQREKEAELIFRGQQYVEGIRLYRQKYGRYPMRMKELWEADPKVLRRKWTDPITGSDKWGLVFQGQEGQELTAPAVDGALDLRRPGPLCSSGKGKRRERRSGPSSASIPCRPSTSIKVYEGQYTIRYVEVCFTEPRRGASEEDAPGYAAKPIGGEQGGPPNRQTPRPEHTGTPNLLIPPAHPARRLYGHTAIRAASSPR